MNILVASEEITNRPRNGTLTFLMHLCRFLHREGELTVVHALGEADADVRSLRAFSLRTFVTRKLVRLARAEKFDIAIHLPASGLSAYEFARGALLRSLARCPTVAIGLQGRSVGGAHRIVSLFKGPDLVLCPPRKLREGLERLGYATGFIMPGYDDRLFKPPSAETRSRLKRKFGFPPGKFVVLHFGHVRESRNLEVLLRYHDWGPDIQPVVKAGEIDPAWAHRLRMAGIIVIDEYLGDVHELYQASDAYLFPVNNPTGAVEFPPSVIEACACNLPVVTTRFGGLCDLIRGGDGFEYYDRISEIAAKIASVRETRPDTAAKVRDLSWEKVFRTHLYPPLRTLAEEFRADSVR